MGTSVPLDDALTGRLGDLRDRLLDMGRVLVAFSGGVDSTFLLRSAHDALGDRVEALTTVSHALPAREREQAIELAGAIGVRHHLVTTDEVAIADYAANPVNRCFFCKDNLYAICREHARRDGFATIVDGVNLDDLGDHRPGLLAAEQACVRHPLVEARLTKADVRRASAALGLPTWDKPASPCLASRFPYGTPITHERLGRIERAEDVVRAHGFTEFRVRFESDRTARLEIPVADLARVLAPGTREAIVDGVRRCGFGRVVVDLAGFASGSLNQEIAETRSN